MINISRLQNTSFIMFTALQIITCIVFLVVVIVILTTIDSSSLFVGVQGIRSSHSYHAYSFSRVLSLVRNLARVYSYSRISLSVPTLNHGYHYSSVLSVARTRSTTFSYSNLLLNVLCRVRLDHLLIIHLR